MKKFLSLVLSLVMTMSLVTIGAGATEYKDFTDKGEVKYAEAVAVLNKIGIITGYEDGSFKPTGALTRGAAAKIIVSLMIGSEAAANLSATAAPYSDVPVTNTFAGVISYCKTAGYINGYADGTFRPTGALTGYAFSKMLLGCLGYDGKTEGFTGSGWTMNVARIGNVAGLFNRLSFSGNTGVTREEACQLALNTLKATKVEYVGGTSVIAGDASVVINGQRQNVVNNNGSDYAGAANTTEQYKTMQFCEEHFKDLKLQSSSSPDDFGRPSNVWAYKTITIGTFAKSPAFTFTAGASGDTSTIKVRNMGIDGYTVKDTTAGGSVQMEIWYNGNQTSYTAADNTAALAKIATETGNGRVVELFTDSDTPELITKVIVIDTQLMQINRISTGNKTVSLKKVDSAQQAVAVVDDYEAELYTFLSGMKADDYVLITPVTYDDGGSYEVYSAELPTVVTGKISRVTLNSSAACTAVFVNGTEYKTAKSQKDVSTLTNTSVSSKQEATLYVDSYGYATYVKNVTSSSTTVAYLKETTTVVDNVIHHVVQGVEKDGTIVSLDVGTATAGVFAVGAAITYTPAVNSAIDADYRVFAALSETTIAAADLAGSAHPTMGVYNATTTVAAGAPSVAVTTSNSVDMGGGANTSHTFYYASNVKFVYIDPANGNAITVKDGVQAVSSKATSHIVKWNSDKSVYEISVVYVMDAPADDTSTTIAYVSAFTGSEAVGAGQKDLRYYTLYIDGVETKNCKSTSVVSAGDFVSYIEKEDGTYTLATYAPANGSNRTNMVETGTTIASITGNGAYLTTNNDGPLTTAFTNLRLQKATIIDLVNKTNKIETVDDLTAAVNSNTVTIDILFNDNNGSSSYKNVSYIFVTGLVAVPAAVTFSPVSPLVISAASTTNTSVTATVSGGGSLVAAVTVGGANAAKVTASINTATGVLTITTGSTWTAGDTATVTVDCLKSDGTAGTSATLTVDQA